ncbi:MAG: LysR family transcriptional regulator, partial [Myxococcaceae bacterium]|nr:LysR family transcriptional regulator [Myxococcaceae bacterium]
MNLQRLEGFYWVARQQGYARAARAFPYPITQPGVHQQVRRLEAELGVKLFERVGKDRVVLTPRGQLLYEGFAPFYERLAQLEAQVKGGVVGGTLKLSAAGHLLRHLMPPWLRQLQARRPDITVALSELAHADLGLLRRGEADLLVDWLPEVPPDVEVREVARAEAWVVAPSHGPYAQKGRLSLAALADVPFIAYHADRQLKALQREALAAHGVSPREAFAADSSDTILGFVAAGLGFSLVPSLTDAGPRASGVVAQKLERPAARFPIYAIWRRGPLSNP